MQNCRAVTTHGATWPFKSSKSLQVFYILSLPIPFQEPCNKRVKPVAKSNSLTGVITPAKTSAFKRIQSISVCPPPALSQPNPGRKHARWSNRGRARDHSLSSSFFLVLHAALPLASQRSISFRTEPRPVTLAPLRPRAKASSFPRRRNSQCWSDTVESHDLTAKEIKRQEVSARGYFQKTKTFLSPPAPFQSSWQQA